jgi:hypothetical protein
VYDNLASAEHHWLGILELAHKYQFETIQNVALKALGRIHLDPVLKIALCDRYGIELGWAVDALATLCTRQEPITVDEGMKMGVIAIVLLAQAREMLREKSRPWHNIPEVNNIIRTIIRSYRYALSVTEYQCLEIYTIS